MRSDAKTLSPINSLSFAVTGLLTFLTATAPAQELVWVQPAHQPAAEEPLAFDAGVDTEIEPVAYVQPVEKSRPRRRVAKQPTTNRVARQQQPPRGTHPVKQAAGDTLTESEVVFANALASHGGAGEVQQACHGGVCGCEMEGPGCACEPGCGCEPGCAVVEPGCEFISGGCGCGDEACGGCGDVVCGGACFGKGPRGVPICIYLPPIENLVVFSGVQGFKNPLDGFRDRGNFGFDVGVNLGGPIPWFDVPGLAYQVGYRATFNQLNGSEFDPAAGVGPGTAESHTQSFFTTGLFKRREVGWQYGVVYDLLHDERIESVEFEQVRGQVSFTNPKGGEIGFLFASATSEEGIVLPPGGEATFAASDQFLGFYRFNAHGGGEFRVLVGGDSDSRAIFGADMLAPLNHSWSINTGFRYFTAPDSEAGIGSTQEAWNLGINLVYHFHRTSKKWHNSPYRPLFDVADNGSLSVDQID